MNLNSAQVENIVRQVISEMNGSTSSSSSNAKIPSTAKVATLVESKNVVVKEYPIPPETHRAVQGVRTAVHRLCGACGRRDGYGRGVRSPSDGLRHQDHDPRRGLRNRQGRHCGPCQGVSGRGISPRCQLQG